MSVDKTNCAIHWIVIYLVPVVQSLDNAIHRINRYPLIHWIAIYPVVSVYLSTLKRGSNFYVCVDNPRA